MRAAWLLALLYASLGPAGPIAAGTAQAQVQEADLDWRPTVVSPAYNVDAPLIRLDEGHGSVQTMAGRYAGFAALMRADGYCVDAAYERFDLPGALDGVAILVIANPRPFDPAQASAFDAAEIDALAQWVAGGGSLLLAADHAPHGTAAEALAARFGVVMGKGYAFQLNGERITTNLAYPRQALADHPIIEGRNADEAVQLVKTFTGQSLKGPPGATVLIAMSDNALEAPDLEALEEIARRLRAGDAPSTVGSELASPALPAQALALEFGAGRVAVLGEAGMLTAQIVQFDDGRALIRFGLNTEGHDDQQFALNLMHWLSRLAP